MIFYLIILLLSTNLILILTINKNKIKKLIYKSKIKSVNLEKLDSVFINNRIDKNLYGPKYEAIVKNFCIVPDNNIVGMTSDYEAWIISSLSKKSDNIFEFGTCSGKTTFLMALNSPKMPI